LKIPPRTSSSGWVQNSSVPIAYRAYYVRRCL